MSNGKPRGLFNHFYKPGWFLLFWGLANTIGMMLIDFIKPFQGALATIEMGFVPVEIFQYLAFGIVQYVALMFWLKVPLWWILVTILAGVIAPDVVANYKPALVDAFPEANPAVLALYLHALVMGIFQAPALYKLLRWPFLWILLSVLEMTVFVWLMGAMDPGRTQFETFNDFDMLLRSVSSVVTGMAIIQLVVISPSTTEHYYEQAIEKNEK